MTLDVFWGCGGEWRGFHYIRNQPFGFWFIVQMFHSHNGCSDTWRRFVTFVPRLRWKVCLRAEEACLSAKKLREKKEGTCLQQIYGERYTLTRQCGKWFHLSDESFFFLKIRWRDNPWRGGGCCKLQVANSTLLYNNYKKVT